MLYSAHANLKNHQNKLVQIFKDLPTYLEYFFKKTIVNSIKIWDSMKPKSKNNPCLGLTIVHSYAYAQHQSFRDPFQKKPSAVFVIVLLTSNSWGRILSEWPWSCVRHTTTFCFAFWFFTALQTVRKAMTHIYYGTENEELRLSLWAVRAGSSFSVPKSAVASFPHCL